MSSTSYFVYGSLVNPRARHKPLAAVPAVLRGWVRQWKHCIDSSSGKVCALTAGKKPGAEILGVVLMDDQADLGALDAREVGYRRIEVPVSIKNLVNGYEEKECFFYVSSPECYRSGNEEYPIWRSYLDCVLAGYWDLGGTVAVEEFCRSTEGWEVPILDDRCSPLYPRSIGLEKYQQAAIDDILAARGILARLTSLDLR